MCRPSAFDLLHCSGHPFRCYQCHLTLHSTEVATLHSLLDSLSKELVEIKAQLPCNSQTSDQSGPTSVLPLPSGSSFATAPNPTLPLVLRHEPTVPPQSDSSNNTEQVRSNQVHQDSKFNIVMFGIAESPPGTSRSDHVEKDERSITQAIQKILPTFSQLLMHDCYWLGKYNPLKSQSCPILISLARVNDVQLISTSSGHCGVTREA